MKKIIVIVSLLALVYSCSSSEDQVQVEETKVEVVANQVANFDVEGMTCKMGCGGTIRKGLLETGAVERVEIDFEDERPSNIIKVHYDTEKTNETELLAVLNELNNNQFTASIHSGE